MLSPRPIHPSHLPVLQSMYANLDRAIGDGETLRIGGGEFLTCELVSLIESLRHSIQSIQSIQSTDAQEI